MIEIELDGQKVEVPPGSMVMDAAHKLGLYVPHFCYHKKLSIAANCRMCLVEVEKAPKPLPACATPVVSGMVVHSASEKAKRAQQEVMEFLLINHPLDCPICDQGGECQLQDLAVGYGKGSSRYQEEKRVVIQKNVGPLISMEGMSRCIHCTRCVRFGQEVAGVMELGVLNRGEHAEITTFVNQTVDSELSGNMIDLCPVGALLSKPFLYTARTWELARRKSISPHDGLGAHMVMQVKNDRVMRVVPLENESINECWISDKDRFSYTALNSSERLTRPMIKQGGQWQEVDWRVALQYVAHALTRTKEAHGAGAIGAIVSPHATLEEMTLLEKIMRGLGSHHIDMRVRADISVENQTNVEAMVGFKPWLGMSIEAFAQLDNVLVVGSFLRKDHPLLAARLRHAAKRGARVSVVHASDDDLLLPVAHKMICAPSAWGECLAEVVAAVAELKGIPSPIAKREISLPAKEIAGDLIAGKRSAIMLGNSVTHHPKWVALHVLCEWIAKHVGCELGYLTEAANTVGGYVANALPGDVGLSVGDMLAHPLRAYVLFQVDPLLDCALFAEPALAQADTVIVCSAFKHGWDYADVMLPIAPFTETSGTFINCEGRAQSFCGVVKPLEETRPGWKVLRVLGNILELGGFEYDTSEAVRDTVLNGQTNVSGLLNNSMNMALTDDLLTSFNLPGEGELERVANIGIYHADMLVRHAEPLQATKDGQPPRIFVSQTYFDEMGYTAGECVKITQGGRSVILPIEKDPGLPHNVVRLGAGHHAAALGKLFSLVSIERT